MGKGEFPTAKNDKGTGCHYSLKDSPQDVRQSSEWPFCNERTGGSAIYKNTIRKDQNKSQNEILTKAQAKIKKAVLRYDTFSEPFIRC